MQHDKRTLLDRERGRAVFIHTIVRHAYLGSIREVMNLLSIGPTWPDPAPADVALHQWYATMGGHKRRLVHALVTESAYSALFGALNVIDGTAGTLIQGTSTHLLITLQVDQTDGPPIAVALNPSGEALDDLHDEFQWAVQGLAQPAEERLRDDDLELHHVLQKRPAAQVVPGYDPETAPAIAIPQQIHRKCVSLCTIRGPYYGTFRALVDKGLRDLRAVGAPEQAIDKLRNLIHQRYGQYLHQESGVRLSMQRDEQTLIDCKQGRAAFIQGIVHDAYLGSIREMMNLLSIGPTWPDPAPADVALHQWYATLGGHERHLVRALVTESVDAALFHALNVIDGTAGTLIRGTSTHLLITLQVDQTDGPPIAVALNPSGEPLDDLHDEFQWAVQALEQPAEER